MKAIVTGSFDPITNGHIEIIKYAAKKYDTVYVVALVNEAKSYMFTMEQKKALIALAVKEFDNVIADAYSGMTADYMHQNGITMIVRGVRNDSDVEYENSLADAMKGFDSQFDTELIRCGEEFSMISSTLVREKILASESLDGLVPKNVSDMIKKWK